MRTFVLCLLFVATSFIAQGQNVKQNKSADWGNRHVKSSSKGGQPDNAVGYLSEGNLAYFSSNDSLFLEQITPELIELGITESNWQTVQDKLRSRWSLTNNKDFKKAIQELNDEIFYKHNCVAVYAEYGGKGGQKAVTIYTKEVWDSLPD